MVKSGAGGERKLRVAVVGPKKTLFQDVSDPRLTVHFGLPPEGQTPDFVVLPCPNELAWGQHQGFDKITGLPAPLLRRLAEGEIPIVFDATAEGTIHRPERTHWLHRGLAQLGAPASRCIYLTQERNYRDDYLAFCGRNNIGPPVQVAYYDLWIRRFLTQFDKKAEHRFEVRRAAFHRRKRLRPRRFMSLNLTPRPIKVLFLLSLMRDGLWSEGHISFGGFQRKGPNKSLEEFDRRIRMLQGFDDLYAQLIARLPDLERLGEAVFGEVVRDAAGQIAKTPLTDNLPQHRESWFSVITETEMRKRPSRITEKAFRSLANFHPLVVFGNPGSLAMLRDLGFATFPTVFDEAYDEEPNPRRRFDMAYEQVATRCRMDEGKLSRRVAAAAEVLEHNARHCMITLPRLYRDEKDPALMDQIIGLRRAHPTACLVDAI